MASKWRTEAELSRTCERDRPARLRQVPPVIAGEYESCCDSSKYLMRSALREADEEKW